jgi:rubrerythrin
MWRKFGREEHAMSTTSIPGASVWEQQLYDHLIEHVNSEGEILRDYERLAEETDSPAFAYLARLILDDERRHHQLLNDLAETIRTSATLSGAPTPIPDLGIFRADREKILAETERFLAAEEDDNRHLGRLAKELGDVRDTTVWQLMIRLIQHDNEKHRHILRFIRDRARHDA